MTSDIVMLIIYGVIAFIALSVLVYVIERRIDPPATVKQRAYIHDLCAKLGMKPQDAVEQLLYLDIDSVQSLSKTEASALITELELLVNY